MAFPVSPTNGQITVVNNVAYQFSNVGNTWTRILSTANVITANTIVINGALTVGTTISATGNVTGNYFIGNGAFLTNVIASVANINSGNSNVSIASPGANVTVGVGGVANVVIFAPDGEYINGVLSVTGNTTLTAVSAGNVSAGNFTTGGLLSAGGNITGGNLITAGILTVTGNITSVANISSGNFLTTGAVSASGNLTGGNILTSGLISATGNLYGFIGTFGNTINNTIIGSLGIGTTGNILVDGFASVAGNVVSNGYFFGNGSQLTGISSTGISNGNSSVAINTTGGNVQIGVNGAANTAVVSLGSFTLNGAFAGPKVLDATVVVEEAVNAMLLGPVSFAANTTIFVPTTSTLYIYSP